ncbi:MAG TPA: LysR substrate-binding domain-containing protein [Pseudonocardia sp.]|uniref:LysR substrate-binding domain-containing protein n=1 Tax=Pseudonocardia sp. TaxID=60912 RepID=UPI002F42BC41
MRGIDTATDLELIEVWRDSLVAVLGEGRDGEPVRLTELADLPLRLTARAANPPLVDLVLGACARAGFEPVLGPRSHSLDDTLAELGAGVPGWTVVYAAHAGELASRRLAFRPLVLPAYLAVRADLGVAALAPLLRTCASQARTDRDR